MSSVLHPVGPERRGTYWRRRLVLLVVLVVLLVLAGLGIRALSTGGGTAPASTTTRLDPDQVSPSPVVSPSAGATAGSTAGATPSTAASQTAGTQPVVACGDADVKVVLTTDSTAYGQAGPPKFTLALYNQSSAPCQVEAGSAVRSFSVTDASGAVVWRSGDCQAQTSSQVFELAPGARQGMTTTWSRQRSQAGCPTGQAKVEPGLYTVQGSWKDVKAEPVQFSITG